MNPERGGGDAVDEEEGGRLGRQAGFDLAGEIALNQGDGDQHGQTDAEREHDLRSRSSRAM